MIIRPYTEVDLVWSTVSMAQAYSTPLSRAWAILTHDEVGVAATGLVIPWEGMAMVWLHCSPQAAFYPVATARALLRLWRQERNHFRRVESLVTTMQDCAHRLHDLAGFRFVQEKRGYGIGGASVFEYVWGGV